MSESLGTEERLSLLEDRLEILKRTSGLLTLLVVVMGVALFYQTSSLSKATSTESLILNAAGRPQGALTAMNNGHLGFVFFDATGKLPESLQSNAIPYLKGFAIYDRGGRPRILMGMDDKDEPILALVSAEGKTLFTAIPRRPETKGPGGNPGATATPPSGTATPPTDTPTP